MMVISLHYRVVKDAMETIGLAMEDYKIPYLELPMENGVNKFKVGNSIIFGQAFDTAHKAKGKKVDITFANEGDSLTKDIYMARVARTKIITAIDLNPDKPESWVYEELDNNPKCFNSHSTYRDNPHTPQSVIDYVEKQKEINPNWYRVYGLGLRGFYEGRIYHNAIKQHFTYNYINYCVGLDFGVVNPTAMVLIGTNSPNGDIHILELSYRTAMTQSHIAETLKLELQKICGKIENNLTWRDIPVVADCADRSSINFLANEGFYIIPSKKRKDSVMDEIRWLQNRNIYYEGDNFDKEITSYGYKINKATGGTEETPDKAKGDDHLMDAMRYGVQYIKYIGVNSPDDYGVII